MKLFFIILSILTSIELFSQNTVVKDTAFEKALIEMGVDNILDGKVLTSSCASIDTLKIAGKQIKDLTGIEAFALLRYLDCSKNALAEINLSHHDSLRYLNCSMNKLTEVSLDKNLKIKVINCSYNQITKLDLSKNKLLLVLKCEYNSLSNLDLWANELLLLVQCYQNRLINLNVSNCQHLQLLYCSYNRLFTVDISANLHLVEFDCSGNPLERVCISKLTAHNQFNDASLYISGNEPLVSILFRIIRK